MTIRPWSPTHTIRLGPYIPAMVPLAIIPRMSRPRAAAPLTTLALAGLAACAGPMAYQNTNWGMNEKALLAARPASVAAGDRRWLEHSTINGLKAAVTYRLGAQGLQDVSIVFDPVQVPQEQYIDTYHQVKVLLSEKYSAPEAEATDLVVRSQKVRIPQGLDYQSKCVFRTPLALIQLTCAGACDGSPGNGIMISYEPPRAPTEGL